MGYQHLLQMIKDGEPVKAGTPNRSLRALDQNIRYLLELIEAANLGSAVFARGATVSSDVLVGQPVYYNVANQRFEPALALVHTDDDGRLVAAPSARVRGIVHSKANATLADILLAGYAPVDLTAAVSGTVEAGLYYLSAATAGQLIRQRPAVGIPVLEYDSNGSVHVNPRWLDPLHDHVHHRFELSAVPAGDHTPPSPGDPHEITDADSSLPGWLPADDAIFNGDAPAGARFGYNLAAHPTLQSAWPPIPVEHAYLTLDRGEDAAQGSQGVSEGLVVLDRRGIWWMSDCYGDVPWPTDYDATASDSASAAGACPRELAMKLVLWFVHPAALTDSAVVTSLTSRDPRLLVRCADDPDLAATRGPLSLDLDLSMLNGVEDEAGGLAIKRFDPDTQTLHRGPVCEGLYAGSDSVVLSGGQTFLRTIGGVEQTVHHGPVKVTLDSGHDRELFVQLIRLDGVEEELYQDVMFLSLRSDQPSSLRARVHIPTTLEVQNPQLTLRLRVFGRVAGAVPQLTVAGRRLTAPSAVATPTALPLTDSALVIPTNVTLTAANQYFDAVSTPIDVAAGEDFLFTVERDGDDGYVDRVGLLRMSALITAGS